jgi:hypothetical protein
MDTLGGRGGIAPTHSGILLKTEKRIYLKKAKVVPLHAMKALGRRGGIAHTHS